MDSIFGKGNNFKINEELDNIVKEAESDVGETVKLPDGLEKYFSVTQLEAIQALQEEGVEKPSDEQVKNKQKELLKLAIETGDITYVQDAIDLINESEN